MKPVKTVNLRGKRFSISRPKRINPELLGWCINKGKPKIAVAYSLDGEEELEIFIHEMLHACYWDMDEEAITDAAQSISNALWRIGYRNTEFKNKNKNNSITQRKKKKSKRKK
jgi:hypothetical protein